MLILGLSGGTALAEQLARRLRCDFSPVWQHRFPDGESLVRIDAPVRGRCVVLCASLQHPDEKTLPLLFTADAARELGATQVGLVAPYLAYLRQDHRFNAGEAVTSRSYARLLSGSLDFLVTVEPHLHRWHSLEEIYPIRTRAVSAAAPIAQWLRHQLPAPLLVGPDEESLPWVREVARLCNAPWTVLTKVRRGDRDVKIRLTDAGPWPGRTPVLVDDIGSSGHTLLAAAAALRGAGLPAPWCVTVHPLFEPDAAWRLLAAGIPRVLSCDSIVHPTNAITLAPVLARAVRDMAGAEPAPRSTPAPGHDPGADA